jgi:glutamate:GABA antiporter
LSWGVDRYLPEGIRDDSTALETPWISILAQSGISGGLRLVGQIDDTTRGAYQFLVDAAIILYCIPFFYMFAAIIRLARRPDRAENPHAILVLGGQTGVWICGGWASWWC